MSTAANHSGTPVAPAVANVAAPTLTEGRVAELSVDLTGALRVTGTTGGPVTIADGADVTQGSIADAAVATDASGTVNAHLRGLVKLLASCISIASGWIAVSIQNATIAVTQSGAWVLSAGSAIIGKVGIDQTTPGTTNKVSIGTDGTVALNAALPAGSNVIGHVIADSGSTTAVTSLPALPAGTNLIGTISASAETSTIYNGTTALTPKFAAISCSSSGVNIVVAAVTSKKIRVLNYTLIANAAVNAKWQSHTAGDKTGLLYLAANTGAAPSYCPVGLFETVAGESLDLNLSGAVAVGGHLTYIEV